MSREALYKVEEEVYQRENIYKKSSRKETESESKHSGKYALYKIIVCKEYECCCKYCKNLV